MQNRILQRVRNRGMWSAPEGRKFQAERSVMKHENNTGWALDDSGFSRNLCINVAVRRSETGKSEPESMACPKKGSDVTENTETRISQEPIMNKGHSMNASDRFLFCPDRLDKPPI